MAKWAPETETVTLRFTTKTLQQLDQEVERIRKNEAWNLLQANRSAVVRWAVAWWLQNPPQNPAELFDLAAPTEEPDLPDPPLYACALCGDPVAKGSECTKSWVLGKYEVKHLSCVLHQAESEKG